MNCKECIDTLSAVQDGEATPAEAAASARHLQSCGTCRAHRAALAQLRQLLAGWSDEVPRGGAVPRGDLSPSIGVRRVAVAAALVLAIAGGFLAGRVSTPVPESAAAPPPPIFTESNVVIVPARNEIYSSAVLRLADSRVVRGDQEN